MQEIYLAIKERCFGEKTPEQRLQEYKITWKQIKQLYKSIEKRYGKCN